MLEQHRSLELSDVLAMFKPMGNGAASIGGDTGFQSMLEQALSSTANNTPSNQYESQRQNEAVSKDPELAQCPAENKQSEASSESARSEQDTALLSRQIQTVLRDAASRGRSEIESGIIPTQEAKTKKALQSSLESKQSNKQLVADDKKIAGKQDLDSAVKLEDGKKSAKLDVETIKAKAERLQQDPEQNIKIESEPSLHIHAEPKAGNEAGLSSNTQNSLEGGEAGMARTSSRKAKDAELIENTAVDLVPQGQLVGGAAGHPVQVDIAVDTNARAEFVADLENLMALSDALEHAQESTALKDALRLVKDLSGRLGLQEGSAKELAGKSDVGNARDSRLNRNELLRRNRLEGVSREGVRVEAGIQRPELARSYEGTFRLVSMPGMQSIRVDDLSGNREWGPYNPTAAQSIVHHTIQLPQGTSPSIANYTSMLKTQLREGLNQELAGQAKILLQGNDKGEIKLVLHPESLGEVKIHLKIEDSAIAGTIFVENKDVLEVFKENLQDLRAAFAEGGLDASLLELSLDGWGGQGGSGGEFAQERGSDPSFIRQAARTLDESVPVLRFQDAGNSLVDVVV